MSANPASTNPSTTTVLTSELMPFTFDFTQVLLPGETLTAATATLTDITLGASTPVTLPDNPTIVNVGAGTSNGISQEVRGTSLTAAHIYRLVVNGTVSATKIWSGPLQISCPF